MDLEIEDRVAVVTGGSKGIGFAAAERLGAAGARLLLTARGEADLDAAVARLRAAGVEAVGHAADVSREAGVEGVHAAAQQVYGRVDIAVCAAGGGLGPLRTFGWDSWVSLFELNTLSALALAMRCVPAMRENGWGRVVFVGSTAAREADPRFAGYGATKAALLHATKTLALTCAKDGVLVNCVVPGLTRTDGIVEGYHAQAERLGVTPEEVERRMMARQPIAAGRTGEPAEVADAIAFLCSQRASWIAGSTLHVDGGTVRVTP